MRLKDYGRNQKKRKEDIHQSGLLLAGMDVSKTKYELGALLGLSPGSLQVCQVTSIPAVI